MSSLREIRISRHGQGGRAVRSSALSEAEIELEIRSLLQIAAAGDSTELLTFLRRPDVLGAAIPSTFPVHRPKVQASFGVERVKDGDERVCTVSVQAEWSFRPTAETGIRNAQDIADLQKAVDPCFKHSLIDILFQTLRSAVDRKDALLQRFVAEALLDMLTKAEPGGGSVARSVPAVSPSSLCLLLDDVMYAFISPCPHGQPHERAILTSPSRTMSSKPEACIQADNRSAASIAIREQPGTVSATIREQRCTGFAGRARRLSPGSAVQCRHSGAA